MNKVGLSEYNELKIFEISGGEQQRVALARAMIKPSKIILADEPTGALDYVTGKKILKLLHDTGKASGKTVIVITHNQALTAMADRIITLKNGKVVNNVLNDNIKPIEEIDW